MTYRPRTKWSVLGWQLFTLAVCLSFSGYFGYHTAYGRYGLEARADLNSRATLLDFEAETLDKVRRKLEHDIALLALATPDPDLVAEIARDLLGYADPSDRIVRLR